MLYEYWQAIGIGSLHFEEGLPAFGPPYRLAEQGEFARDVADTEQIGVVLDALWSRHNADDRPRGKEIRSMSVGDVVVMEEDDYTIAFVATAQGWKVKADWNDAAVIYEPVPGFLQSFQFTDATGSSFLAPARDLWPSMVEAVRDRTRKPVRVEARPAEDMPWILIGQVQEDGSYLVMPGAEQHTIAAAAKMNVAARMSAIQRDREVEKLVADVAALGVDWQPDGTPRAVRHDDLEGLVLRAKMLRSAKPEPKPLPTNGRRLKL